MDGLVYPDRVDGALPSLWSLELGTIQSPTMLGHPDVSGGTFSDAQAQASR